MGRRVSLSVCAVPKLVSSPVASQFGQTRLPREDRPLAEAFQKDDPTTLAVDEPQASTTSLAVHIEDGEDPTIPAEVLTITHDIGIQVSTLDAVRNQPLSISTIQDEKALNVLSGLPCFQLFYNLCDLYTDCRLLAHAKGFCISNEDAVLLTFMKLQHNLTFSVLGVLFGVHRTTAADIFKVANSRAAHVAAPTVQSDRSRRSGQKHGGALFFRPRAFAFANPGGAGKVTFAACSTQRSRAQFMRVGNEEEARLARSSAASFHVLHTCAARIDVARWVVRAACELLCSTRAATGSRAVWGRLMTHEAAKERWWQFAAQPASCTPARAGQKHAAAGVRARVFMPAARRVRNSEETKPPRGNEIELDRFHLFLSLSPRPPRPSLILTADARVTSSRQVRVIAQKMSRGIGVRAEDSFGLNALCTAEPIPLLQLPAERRLLNPVRPKQFSLRRASVSRRTRFRRFDIGERCCNLLGARKKQNMKRRSVASGAGVECRAQATKTGRGVENKAPVKEDGPRR
ncbi:hypothetical protein HPB50_018077 [Hyalomma asiaticum]|uniref:Uncharacterized protein n=1 Tax=Hyalomma asiaticum TaxID=266040 RepID=A0ACB7SCA1_HYAAI|nr:hypothetical protein HPB50_018077 [Hyalomma asiaticum]